MLLVLDEMSRIGLARVGYTPNTQTDVGSRQSVAHGVQLLAGEVATLYIHQQIETIDKYLNRLASSKTFRKGE